MNGQNRSYAACQPKTTAGISLQSNEIAGYLASATGTCISTKTVKIGARVSIVLKADQRTGKRTESIVARLLTKSHSHPHGIKVMLEDGQVGRAQEIL